MSMHAAEMEIFKKEDEVNKREDALPPTLDSLAGQMIRKFDVDQVHFHLYMCIRRNNFVADISRVHRVKS